ncbi:MAG: glycosyltransferase [Chitinophagia bacterium]|jgi:glycosyltransferase involved in cell wall biosynthesis
MILQLTPKIFFLRLKSKIVSLFRKKPVPKKPPLTPETLFQKLKAQIIFLYYTQFVFVKTKTEKRQIPRFFLGLTPIINNKHWANAIRKQGYSAINICTEIPIINSASDFDQTLSQLFPIEGEKDYYKVLIQKLKLMAYILENFDILIMSFRFNILSDTPFWDKEAKILKERGIKTVIIPYGSDFYMYSKVIDQSMKHNLMINVANETFNEKDIEEKAFYWRNNADFIMMGFMVDAAGRWNCLPTSPLCIDSDNWNRLKPRSLANGKNGLVTIAHTPNHRGFKGTEFIIRAINELKEEGFKVELILIEKMQNSEVKRILQEEADILVEQLIFSGYALSGIEGMAVGIPVMSNLDRSDIVQVFRRYSYLNECPILSTTPETLKDNLKLLITNPDLRETLGRAGREYVFKYQSYDAFGSLINEVVKKIWHDEDVDTMNFYNPQKSDSYNNSIPLIKHPLINSSYFTQETYQ